MPAFVYTGPSQRITIRGRSMARGIPVEAEGELAERLADHPAFKRVSTGKSTAKAPGKAPASLAARQALVARAKELGIPAKGKNAELQAAIDAAEAAG